MANNPMSFLPDDYVERRVEQRTNLICLSLFAVVLAAVLGAWAVTSNQRREVLKEQQAINAEYAEAAKRIAQLNELQQTKRELVRKARITHTLVEPIPRSNLLAELINRMPGTLSLLEMELSSKQLVTRLPRRGQQQSAMANARQRNTAAGNGADTAEQAPPAPRYQVEVELVGVAPTDIQVAQYMAALARCQLLDEVDLVYSEEKNIDEVVMRKFKVVMTLDPEVDIREIEPFVAEGRLETQSAMGGFAGVDKQPFSLPVMGRGE